MTQEDKELLLKENVITEEILLNAGFERLVHETDILAEYQNEAYGIDNYKVFGIQTNDYHPIKLVIDNGWNNRGTIWHLHIDNNECETIGSADISYVWQFNKLMEVFDSKFRL